jgi:hypothetical protein
VARLQAFGRVGLRGHFPALLVYQLFIGPLLLAFIITSCCIPSPFISATSPVFLARDGQPMYAILVVLLVATFTVTGLALFQQS